MIHRPCLNFVLRCSFGLIGNYQALNELLESNPFTYPNKKGLRAGRLWPVLPAAAGCAPTDPGSGLKRSLSK